MAERRLTVVQILPALDGGGVEQGTLEVATELVKRGHRSIVISNAILTSQADLRFVEGLSCVIRRAHWSCSLDERSER